MIPRHEILNCECNFTWSGWKQRTYLRKYCLKKGKILPDVLKSIFNIFTQADKCYIMCVFYVIMYCVGD